MLTGWQMSNNQIYLDYCSLFSGSEIPSIWTFNCPCPLIRTKHGNSRNHVCRFQDQPTFSHASPQMIDFWYTQFDALNDAFKSYREPATYMTHAQINAYYGITKPSLPLPISLPESSSSSLPPPSASSSSSSSSSSTSSQGEEVVETTKERELSMFEDVLEMFESEGIVLRTKQCNRIPFCSNLNCTYNHSVAAALSVFHLPRVIQFYKNEAKIVETSRMPTTFTVCPEENVCCRHCKENNPVTFHLVLILYCSSTRHLKYPELLLDCRLCTRKTRLSIYL